MIFFAINLRRLAASVLTIAAALALLIGISPAANADVLPSPADVIKMIDPTAQIGVTEVIPDPNACGGETTQELANCAAHIVASNTPLSARIHLVWEGGYALKLMPWGDTCNGTPELIHYCGDVYLGVNALANLSIDTIEEMVFTIGHENTHATEAVGFPGGPGSFMSWFKASNANIHDGEESADIGGGRIVKMAVMKGQLPPTAENDVLALLGRIGQAGDEAHGKGERVDAGRQGMDEAQTSSTQ